MFRRSCFCVLIGLPIGCDSAPTTVQLVASSSPTATPFIMPGLRTPPAKPAVESTLDDDADVLGVVVGDRARAYDIRIVSRMSTHVINDLLGDVPVTVTFCDRTNCVRGFTSTVKGQPLDVYTGGFADEMLLRDGTGMYRQSDQSPFAANAPAWPHPTYPVERTTWKQWRTQNPMTDVVEFVPTTPTP